MEEIIKEYAPSIKKMVAYLALTAVVVAIIAGGFFQTQIESALTQFFSNMNGYIPTVTP